MPTLELPKIIKSAASIDDKKIVFQGKTVLQVIQNACQANGSLTSHVLYKNNDLKSQFLISVNDSQAEPDTSVEEGDVIELMIATSGGAPNHNLSAREVKRYSRHLTLPEVGVEGQMKLSQSKVLIVGLGGLGAPVAMYLAAMGIGTLGLVEFDEVEYSNLQRQIIYGTSDLGKRKVDSAEAALKNINELITYVKHDTRLDVSNAEDIIKQYDIVVDGTDNFATRYLVNDVCVLHNKPYVFSSILGFEGQVSVLNYNGAPCYRCIFPEPPAGDLAPNCAVNGVLGVLPGLMGTIQATEVVKILLDIGDSLKGKLLIYSALDMSFKKLSLKRNHKCSMCSENATITNIKEIEESCALNISDDVENKVGVLPVISAHSLRSLLDEGCVQVIDVRENTEVKICSIENSINIPLRQLSQHLAQMKKDKSYVVYCKSGARSSQAVVLMRESGFSDVKSLTGGILRWSKDVDESVLAY